jgi:hypothetical protein
LGKAEKAGSRQIGLHWNPEFVARRRPSNLFGSMTQAAQNQQGKPTQK